MVSFSGAGGGFRDVFGGLLIHGLEMYERLHSARVCVSVLPKGLQLLRKGENMRHICSGEDICGMAKKDDRGNTIHVSDQMDRCAERNPSARIIHCGAARVNVSFERGQKSKKVERVESLYMLRDMRLFKDESKAEFLTRMKRAQNGAYQKKPGMRG